MGTPTWFDNLLTELEGDLDYIADGMAFDYVNDIRRVMKEQKITQSELAKRIGKSRAYVSKVLNYNPNMTIRSLAMIALALDLRWTHPHLVKKDVVDYLDHFFTSSDEFRSETTMVTVRPVLTLNHHKSSDEWCISVRNGKGSYNGTKPFGLAA